MAQISPQHTAPLTSGFVALLVFGVIAIGVLNHIANK